MIYGKKKKTKIVDPKKKKVAITITMTWHGDILIRHAIEKQ